MTVFRSLQVGEFLYESMTDGVIAAGTTQATAYQLTPAECSRVTSGIGKGVMLPPAQEGLSLVVVNHSGGTITIYGQPGDSIDDAPTGVGVPQMSNSYVYFTCFTAGAWYTEGLASGFQALSGGAFSTQSVAGPLTAGQTHTAAAATQITANQVLFGTVATTTDAAVLPPAKPGMQITVINNGANVLQVWTATNALGGTTGGDTINGASTTVINIAVSVNPTIFYCFSNGAWFTK